MPPTMKRSRKQRTDAAIAYALERRWDEAAAENRSLLNEFADDLESANRLGKALTELGDLDGATAAYGRSLEIDASNVIARRNLSRIEELRGQTKSAPAGRTTRSRRAGAATPPPIAPALARAHSLIEESGRSAEFTLVEPNAQALQSVSAGDTAELVPTPRGVSIQSAAGALLGHIEPRTALRLRRLLDGGNQYAVVIRRIGEGGGDTTIYIRETHRAAELADQPSFLQPSTAARKRTTTRAYTKASMLRYETTSTLGDEDEGDSDSWEPRAASDDDDEMDGFGDTNLQDDDNDDDDDDDDDEGLIVDDDDPVVTGDDEDDL